MHQVEMSARTYFHMDPYTTIGVALTNHDTGKTMGLFDIHVVTRLSKEIVEQLWNMLRILEDELPYEETVDAVQELMKECATVERDANLLKHGIEYAIEFSKEGAMDVSLWTYGREGKWEHVCMGEEGSHCTFWESICVCNEHMNQSYRDDTVITPQ